MECESISSIAVPVLFFRFILTMWNVNTTTVTLYSLFCCEFYINHVECEYIYFKFIFSLTLLFYINHVECELKTESNLITDLKMFYINHVECEFVVKFSLPHSTSSFYINHVECESLYIVFLPVEGLDVLY